MANVDNPRGFWPIRHLSGGEIRTNTYTLTTGEIMYEGSLVIATSAGTVSEAGDAATTDIIGVSASFVDDSASAGGKTVEVYDDPMIVFGAQVESAVTPAAGNVFNVADNTATAGSSTTGISGMEIDGLTTGSAKAVLIIGLASEVNNAWGQHADVEVLINAHNYKNAYNGI